MRDGTAHSSHDHGARMDQVYGWTRHIYDASRKYYLLGRDPLIRGLAVQPGQALLEVGCGTGRNLRMIARHYPAARLFGLDASTAMLATARTKLAKAGVQAELIHGFAEKASLSDMSDAPQAGFDHILFPYSLSMIPDWRASIDNAVTLLAPGGRLHVVDFGPMQGWSRPFKGPFRRFLSAYHVAPRDGLRDYLGELGGLSHLTQDVIGGGYAWRFQAIKAAG